MVNISTDLLARLIGDASAHDEEICGLLLGSADRIEEARRCANVAADPARRFELDPAALIAAHRSARAGGASVIGHYHSHPSGTAIPSACDAQNAAPDGSYWLILAGGTARLWRALPAHDAAMRFAEVTLATD